MTHNHAVFKEIELFKMAILKNHRHIFFITSKNRSSDFFVNSCSKKIIEILADG